MRMLGRIMLVVIFMFGAAWFFVRGIARFSYSTAPYHKVIHKEGVEEAFQLWAQKTLPRGCVVPRTTPGTGPSMGPADCSYAVGEPPTFMPLRGFGMEVELFVDREWEIEAVYIGRSGRAGMIFLLKGSFEDIRFPASTTNATGRIAVYGD